MASRDTTADDVPEGGAKTGPKAGPMRADRVAVDMLLRRALRRVPGLRAIVAGGSVVVVVEVPDASFVAPVSEALRGRLFPKATPVDGDQIPNRLRERPWPVVVFERDGTDRYRASDSGNHAVAAALAGGSAVVGIAPVPERALPAALLHAADHRLVVPPLDAGAVAGVIAAVTGRRPAERLPEELCRSLSLDDLCTCIRPGSTADRCVARLRDFAANKADAAMEAGPRLADLHGLDEARAWGETLARDFDRYRRGALPWSEVDRGLLLVGPTGTGKTTFAKALARTCDCPLVAGSLARWQAAGHLGELLKAMSRTFDEARKLAPCILFIDEIDSFGDRATFSHDHRNYAIQVVNALLEELDGVQDRAGVVVVAATNDADRLDPAIRRSGRLDRTIRLDLPDAAALCGIFRYHLGKDLAGEDLQAVALAAVGGTGADVERWVRGARRAARDDGRPMAVADLMAEVGARVLTLPPESLQRVAVHEAGHAVAASLGGVGRVARVTLLGAPPNIGATTVRGGATGLVTRSDCRRRLVFVLAGRAAEEVVLGEPSSSAGGGRDSDLARATELAAAMESSFGLARRGGLLWLGPAAPGEVSRMVARDPALAARAAALLDQAYEEAVGLMRRHRAAVVRVADALLTGLHLDGEQLAALLHDPPSPGAASARSGASDG